MNFLVERLKAVVKCCLIFFHGALYCRVRYSNIGTSKLIINSTTQKVMAKSSVGRRFHDIKDFEVEIFFIFLEFIINLRAPL